MKKIIKNKGYYYQDIKVLEYTLYDSKDTEKYILEIRLDDVKENIIFDKKTKKAEDIRIDYIATPLISAVLFGRHKVNLTDEQIEEEIVIK